MDRWIQGILLELLDIVGSSGRDLDALLAGFLSKVIQATGAERGMLLRIDPGETLVMRLAFDGQGRRIEGMERISRSLPLEAARTRSGICRIRGFDETGEVPTTHSMDAYSLRSVLCVPLETRQGVIGILYLDSEARIRLFEDQDLERLKVLCDHLALHIENARLWEERRQTEESRRQALEQEISRLQKRLAEQEVLVGDSPVMRRLLDQVRKVAATDATVLLQGETGTGKEMVAQLIHASGSRADHPFLVIDSCTIPETLLESELFGHEKGAFTGADARRIGKFELAHRGTIFLDEVGDLPQQLQGKFLRVLESRTIQRVGSSRPIATDIRLIAATNRDLEEMAGQGLFRSDLFFRLNVIRITLPPLRDRGRDRILLAEHFLSGFAAQYSKIGLRLSPEARAAIEAHPWPGNVREMKHRVQRAAIMAEGDVVGPWDLDFGGPSLEAEPTDPASGAWRSLERLVGEAVGLAPEDPEPPEEAPLWPSLVEPVERWLVRRALELARGNKSAAARLLGVERRRIARAGGEHRPDGEEQVPEELRAALEEELRRRSNPEASGEAPDDLFRALHRRVLLSAVERIGRHPPRLSRFLGMPASTLRRRLRELPE